MANDATVIVGKLDDKALRESIDSLVNTVNSEMGKLAKGFDESIMQMNASLKKLGSTNTGSGGTSDSGSGRRTKAQQEEAKAAEATKNVYDQQADAMQKATTNAKTYSEEVMKLAASIREMKEWQEKGRVLIGDDYYYDPDKSLAPLKSRKTLEEQIVSIKKEQEEAERRVKRETESTRAEKEKESTATQQSTSKEQEKARLIGEELKKAYELYDKIFNIRRKKIDELFDSAGGNHDEFTRISKEVDILRKKLGTLQDAMKKLHSGQLVRINMLDDNGINEKAEKIKYSTNEVRNAIASLLNIEEAEVKKINLKTSSYNQLTSYLKQVQAAYKNLDGDLAKSGSAGKILADEMIRVNREIQKIQSAQSRPSNLKSVLGFEPKTLGDITYKMQLLDRYREGIDVTDKTKAGEIREVNEAYAQLQKKQQEILGQNKSMFESNNALARSFNYMKNRLAFYFTVGASTQFVKQIYDIRSQYELLDRSIGILIDNMQRGSQIFAELNAMAIKSPFTTMELGAAAKQLVAYDVAAEDVVDTTRRLADMAAAVGIPIERLTYALGQIKSYGYLNARDARMFANAGIPLVKELAERYTQLEGRLVSMADVYDRIKKKAISYNDVMETVNKMTDEGGKFFNFQEKAADTMKVRLANLTLAYNNMLNEMGKSNQTLLTQPLVIIKNIFEVWRDIDAAIMGTAKIIGTIKTLQLAWYLLVKKTGWELALMQTFGAKIGDYILNTVNALKALAKNPFTWVAVAIVSLGYLFQKYSNLQAANEEFNNSIRDNAKENINIINKFFDEYKKRIDSIASENASGQAKMWEKIQEEIKNTTKDADGYIERLEKINNVAERVQFGRGVLEQTELINKEIERLANLKIFDIGGGFADENLARNLKSWENAIDGLIKDYGDLKNAYKNSGFFDSLPYIGRVEKTTFGLREVNKELDKFVSKLDKGNLQNIMGSSGDASIMLSNIRSYATSIRDAFLATEDGQKISITGQAKMNREIDKWIAEKATANKLISEEQRAIESNRTAWEIFFNGIRRSDKERIDYMIRTNKTGSEDFKKIWDKAAETMKENARQSYSYIAKQIAELRNTPDIVINVVYRQAKGSLDEQQKQFQKTFLTPTGADSLTTEEYFDSVQKLMQKYGRFQRGQDEDNVEWEKRLGEEYQDNIKNIESLNNQLKESAKLSDADRKQKEKERDSLVDVNKALDDVAKAQNFNYEQFKKGGGGSKKDVLGEALQKEVEIVTNMQKKFNEYRSAGVSAQEAVTKATDEYGSTLKTTNATLAKYGIATKNGKELSQMRLRDIRDYFVSLREEAVKLGNTKGIEALEKGIANLNTEITKLDYKRITEGLNNELAKLKDEYKLSVELGADPELGDMFTSLFDIDPSQLPKTIDEYAERVLQRLNAYFRNTKVDLQLPTLNLTDADLDSYRQMLYDDKITQDAFSSIESSVKAIREMRYSEVRDLHSQIKDLQYELADQYGKIVIEEKKLSVLRNRLANESREEQKRLLELQIEKQEQVITELKSGILQLMPTYKKLFGDVSEYSAATTRRLANNLKQAYLNAQKNVVGTQKKGDKLVALYQYVDPESGETVIMTIKELGQAIEKVDKEASKSKSTFEKLKDAFEGNSQGVKDSAKGIELIGEELNKVADGVRLAGNIAQALGADEETVGVINDIGQALDGLGQVAQGIGQMATDPIGGVVNVIGGMFSAIGSIFNGYNRRINREIEKSEKAVDQLSLAYQRLEFAVEKSMGSTETYWRRAAIENKKMQLEELQRQLQLEQSRKQKDQDEEKQTQLRSQIISLQQEIDNLSEEVVSTLTGSDVKSAAEEFVDTWVQAWKAGETTLDAIEEKMDSVIENIIKKAMTNKIVGALLDPLYNEVDRMTRAGSEGGEELTTAELRQLAEKAGVTAKDINVALGEFYGNLESLGIVAKTQEESKQLSALQQGLQSMSETTANALEAYANSISQQVYLHSTLLTEIRDILLGGDSDMSMGVQAQMLLELQQSHQVQAAIHAILQGWSNANGMAVRVELV